MTPKEKAKELILQFSDIGLITSVEAKQCALIAVYEIVEVLYNANDTDEEYGYWTDVKQELIQL